MKKFILLSIICLGLAANAGAVELSGGELHGFISQGYLNSSHNNFLSHDSKDGSFEYMEMGINFNRWLTPNLTAGFQLFAKDLGKAENQEVKLDWAILNYHWKPWLNAKAGRLKLKTGLYNDTRDIDMVRPWALLPQSCYLEYFRDASLSLDGGAFYGNLPGGKIGDLSYEVYLGTKDINTDRDGTMTRFIEDNTTFVNEDIDKYDFDSVWGLNLEWQTPVEGLIIGASHTKTDLRASATFREDTFGGPPMVNVNQNFDPATGTTTVTATVTTMAVNAGDLLKTRYLEFDEQYYYIRYIRGNLELCGECWHQRDEKEITTWSTGDIVATTETTVIPAAGPPTTSTAVNVLANSWTNTMIQGREALGYYVSAAYRFSHWFQLAGYYSVAFPDKDDKSGIDEEKAGNKDYEAWLKDTCITLRFDVGTNWTFKLENHFMDGVAYLNRAINNDLEQHWNLFVAKATYMF